jgi:hypothetical protein
MLSHMRFGKQHYDCNLSLTARLKAGRQPPEYLVRAPSAGDDVAVAGAHDHTRGEFLVGGARRDPEHDHVVDGA